MHAIARRPIRIYLFEIRLPPHLVASARSIRRTSGFKESTRHLGVFLPPVPTQKKLRLSTQITWRRPRSDLRRRPSSHPSPPRAKKRSVPLFRRLLKVLRLRRDDLGRRLYFFRLSFPVVLVYSSFHAPSPPLIESHTHTRTRARTKGLSLCSEREGERERARAAATRVCVRRFRGAQELHGPVAITLPQDSENGAE